MFFFGLITNYVMLIFAEYVALKKIANIFVMPVVVFKRNITHDSLIISFIYRLFTMNTMEISRVHWRILFGVAIGRKLILFS